MKRRPESILKNQSAPKSTKFDESPLHLQLIDAAKSGDVAVVNYLISQGVNVNQADNDGFSPLHMAAQEGQTDVARILIELGAKVNQTVRNGRNGRYGYTPMHVAAQYGHFDIVMLLIESGSVRFGSRLF